MSDTKKTSVNNKLPVENPSLDSAKRKRSKGNVDRGPMPSGLLDPPPVNSAIRQQATDWVSKGLIGRSVVDGDRAEGYVRVTSFSLAPTPTPTSTSTPTPTPTPAPDASQFRYWHCDDLLDSAAALIDRFLAIQVEWRDKLARSFQVESEINEYLLCEQVYAEEVARGLYEVPVIEARQTALSDKNNLAGSESALSTAQTISTTIYSQSQQTKQKEVGNWTTWLNALPLSDANFNEVRHSYRANFMDGTWVGGNKAEVLRELGLTAMKFQFDLAETMARLDLQRQGASVDTVRARAVGTQRRSDWESLNGDFRRRRMNAQRAAAEAKVGAFTMPGGALNYREQMATLTERMSRDASDALDRLTAAAKGLKAIYGRDVPLPASVSSAITSRNASHAVVDEACTWTRNAIAWLAAFKQLEINVVIPVSLRALMTHNDWTVGKENGVWNFVLPASFFGNLTHIRLRGLRAYAYGVGPEAGYYYSKVRLPLSGAVSHGTTPPPPPLDQTGVPVIYLPKTGARSNFADLEFCGLHGAFNTSPIGIWSAATVLQSTQRVPLSQVEDFELELAVAGRPANGVGTSVLGLPDFGDVSSPRKRSAHRH